VAATDSIADSPQIFSDRAAAPSPRLSLRWSDSSAGQSGYGGQPTDDEYGAPRLAQHTARDAAQQSARERTVAARANDDQVDPVRVC